MSKYIKIKSLIPILLIGIALLTLVCCAGMSKSFKEQTLDDMYPILSEEQYKMLKSLSTDEEMLKYIERYWNEIDLVSELEKGKIKEIYLERLNYANEHYPDRRGWGRSDQKRIYIVYGPPSSIEREEFKDIQIGEFSKIKSLQIWLYMRPGKNNSHPSRVDELYKGQRKFIFGDVAGTGHYELLYSSEDSGNIDLRMLYKH